MLLAIEQGNTNTLFAVHDGREWVAQWRTGTDSTRTAGRSGRSPVIVSITSASRSRGSICLQRFRIRSVTAGSAVVSQRSGMLMPPHTTRCGWGK